MITFKDFYNLKEDSSYADGTLGISGNIGGIGNTDWYAPGDYRIPMGKKVYTRKGLIKRRRKRKYKK